MPIPIMFYSRRPARLILPGRAFELHRQRAYRHLWQLLPGLFCGALSGALISCAPPTKPPSAPAVPLRSAPAVASPPAAALLPTVTPEQVAAAELAVHQKPQNVEAHLALADRYVLAAKPSEAARELRAAVRLQPRSLAAHQRLAALYRDNGYLDREYAELQKIAALAPDDWQAGLREGEIDLQLGWLDMAQKALERAERAAPIQVKIQADLATLALLQHDYHRMEAHARNGRKLAPNDPTVLVILSDALRLQGRLPESESTLNDAIKLMTDPQGRIYYQIRMAHLLLETGWKPARTADAEKVALAALQGAPDDLEGRYWLARAQELQGHLSEAETNYALTAKQDIQFESVAFFLGRIYQRSSDPNKKMQGKQMLALYHQAEANSLEYANARQAVNRRPNDAMAHRTAAEWNLKLGHVPAAILEFRRTLEITPNDRTARRLLAQALRAAGRASEAKQLKI